MKYIVELNGERHAVSLTADSIAYEGEPPTSTELSDIEGSPVSIVKIGPEVFRVVVEKRDGRGRYFLWIDGYRYEAEALDERRRALRDLSGANDGPGSGPHGGAHGSQPRASLASDASRAGAGD